jgi:hypothetical protein
MKRKINFNLIVALMLLLLSLAMAGLFSWAKAGFRPDPLSDDEFWFSLSISTIINFFALMASISYELPEQLDHNPAVKEKRTALLEFNVTTDPSKLEEFVIDLNLKRKKKVYITKIENDRKSFIKKFKPTLIDKKILHSGTSEEKANNEYCLKIAEFNYLKSEEYLKENLLYLNLKFPEITSSMIVSESMSRSDGLGYIYTASQKSRWWVGQIIPRYVSGMLLSLAWATFFIEMTDAFDSLFWLDFTVRVVGMLINIAGGLYVVRSFVQKVTIGDLDFRLSVARQYIIWMKNSVVIEVKKEL